MKLKYSLIIVLFIGIVIVSGSFIFLNNKYNSDETKFVGTVKTVNDGEIVITGTYGGRITSGLITESISVDSDVKITKTSFVKPKGGEMYRVDDLPKEVFMVDFATLKNDSENVAIGMEVILKRNFYGKPVPVAEEIKYIAPKF